MKLVAVLGSSRPDAVSTKIAECVMKSAEEAGCEVVVFHANDMNMKGCRGCNACRKNGTDCVMKDDMQQYFRELHTCDALLLTAPNYCSQVAGPMITFMNRHYCMSKPDHTSRLEPGKKLIGIFSQGAPEGIDRYEANYDWYLSIFERHMELTGKIVAGGNSDLSENGSIMTKARQLGRRIAEEEVL
ncbi:MAG: flavodoxin family protein [Lachnospiraceae bacterium]|nr:flavodoxin family protein [Lachnospiraceae bacterium]MDY4968890.1 flavodoxin family protein [Lachnospiraceae bacterium]